MGDQNALTQTLLLVASEDSPAEARDLLFRQVYSELRRMAAAYLRRERRNHTLRPTELVHEAFLKLVGTHRDVGWQGQAHFFGAAARAMRQVLVSDARRKAATKRPPRDLRVSLHEEMLPAPADGVDLIPLNDLLDKLAQLDERMARIVELRIFGGLTAAEIAVVIGVSSRTVEADWAIAKKWLRRELS